MAPSGVEKSIALPRPIGADLVPNSDGVESASSPRSVPSPMDLYDNPQTILAILAPETRAGSFRGISRFVVADPQGRLTKNIQGYLKDYERDPSQTILLVELGKAYNRLGEYEKANFAYSAFINKEPNNPKARQLRIETNQAILKLFENPEMDLGGISTESCKEFFAELHAELGRDQAMVLALGANQQIQELKNLEKELKALSTLPLEQQRELLEPVEAIAHQAIALSLTGFSNREEGSFVQEKLNDLAVKTYRLLARVADNSNEPEIKIRALYYEALAKLTEGRVEEAKEELETVVNRVPEAAEQFHLLEQADKRNRNLAALGVWEVAIAEEQIAVRDWRGSALGSSEWAADHLVRKHFGDGKSLDDDQAIAIETEKTLITEVKEKIISGDTPDILTALWEIASLNEDQGLKNRALELYQRATQTFSKTEGAWDIIPRLFQYVSTDTPDPLLEKDLLEKGQSLRLAGASLGLEGTYMGVFNILHGVSLDPEIRRITEEHLQSYGKEKGLGIQIEAMIRSTSVTELGLMMAGGYLGTASRLATFEKFHQAGMVGWKAAAAAGGVERLVEGSALWALSTGQQVMTHDVDHVLDRDALLKSYGTSLIMVSTVKSVQRFGQTYTPRVVQALGLMRPGVPLLNISGRALLWTGAHLSGVAGMIGATQTNDLLGFHEAGEFKNSLVLDVVNYVRFALAHRVVDGVAGGRLNKVGSEQYRRLAVLEAKNQVEALLPRLRHGIKGRTEAGEPIFRHPDSQKLYEQWVQFTLTKPGFNPKKLNTYLEVENFKSARAYAEKFSLRLEFKGLKLTQIREISLHEKFHAPIAPPKISAFIRILSTLGARRSSPIHHPAQKFVTALRAGLATFLFAGPALAAVGRTAAAHGDKLATLGMGLGFLAMAINIARRRIVVPQWQKQPSVPTRAPQRAATVPASKRSHSMVVPKPNPTIPRKSSALTLARDELRNALQDLVILRLKDPLPRLEDPSQGLVLPWLEKLNPKQLEFFQGLQKIQIPGDHKTLLRELLTAPEAQRNLNFLAHLSKSGTEGLLLLTQIPTGPGEKPAVKRFFESPWLFKDPTGALEYTGKTWAALVLQSLARLRSNPKLDTQDVNRHLEILLPGPEAMKSLQDKEWRGEADEFIRKGQHAESLSMLEPRWQQFVFKTHNGGTTNDSLEPDGLRTDGWGYEMKSTYFFGRPGTFKPSTTAPEGQRTPQHGFRNQVLKYGEAVRRGMIEGVIYEFTASEVDRGEIQFILKNIPNVKIIRYDHIGDLQGEVLAEQKNLERVQLPPMDITSPSDPAKSMMEALELIYTSHPKYFQDGYGSTLQNGFKVQGKRVRDLAENLSPEERQDLELELMEISIQVLEVMERKGDLDQTVDQAIHSTETLIKNATAQRKHKRDQLLNGKP